MEEGAVNNSNLPSTSSGQGKCFSSSNRKDKRVAKFSNEDDEELIEIVAGYEILWNLSHPEYKSNIKKDVIWNKIGLQLNKTGEECKARWRSVRDNFKRHKKIEVTGTGQPAKKKRATYWDQLRFLDNVEDERPGFTNTEDPGTPTHDKTVVEGNNDTSLDLDIDYVVEASFADDVSRPASANSRRSSSSPTWELPTIPKVSKKPLSKGKNCLIGLLKRRAVEQTNLAKAIDKLTAQEAQEDEIDVFMKSMTMTIKKFTPEEQSEAKREIFQIVNGLEDRHHARARSLQTFS